MFIASLTLGIFKLEPVSCGQWRNFSFWSFTDSSFTIAVTACVLLLYCLEVLQDIVTDKLWIGKYSDFWRLDAT